MQRWYPAVIVLALAACARGEIKTQEIEYQHGDTALQGYLAYDDATDAKRPGVLVVHEWWGNNDYSRKRARMLAESGYVAFALDMYGKGKVTDDPKQAGAWAGELRGKRQLIADRADAALKVLREQALVDPDRSAAIGYCFGGMVVLEMARAGMDPDGVVSFHGSLKTSDPVQADQIKPSVLVCNGADDKAVPPEEIAAFQNEMRGAKADWQLIQYGGSVHAFTNPDADKAGMENVAYNEKADYRSWEAMKAFFKEIFAK